MGKSEIEIFKALSDESRIRIIHILMQGPLCVCEIETVLQMSQSNVSRHLNKLKETEIVLASKKSQWIYYTLREDFQKSNLLILEHLKSRFFLEHTFSNDLEHLKTIRLDEICKKKTKGEIENG